MNLDYPITAAAPGLRGKAISKPNVSYALSEEACSSTRPIFSDSSKAGVENGWQTSEEGQIQCYRRATLPGTK